MTKWCAWCITPALHSRRDVRIGSFALEQVLMSQPYLADAPLICVHPSVKARTDQPPSLTAEIDRPRVPAYAELDLRSAALAAALVGYDYLLMPSTRVQPD